VRIFYAGQQPFLFINQRYFMDAGIQNLWLFVLAGWALNLTPGPDVFYMLAHSLRGGARAGMVAVAGICSGCLVHVAAATLGLSALVAASSTAFTVLKWVGAAYLVYVGWKMLRTKLAVPTDSNAINLVAARADSMPASGQFSYKTIFLQGFWTNVLNPKVALFFLAFLPQFIAPQAAQPSLAFLLLGLLFILNSLPINMAYVLLAAWLTRRARVVQGSLLWLERAAGAALMGFGIQLALSDNAKS
jgi:threonine/homoserine/homoserine lactone efflux protein